VLPPPQMKTALADDSRRLKQELAAAKQLLVRDGC
jgi:hypothetical protein